MLIAADTHAHIYEDYDLHTYFSSAFKHLKNGVIFLTQSAERSHSFQEILARLSGLSDFNVEALGGLAELIDKETGNRLYIVPGAQFISRDKIEVLALTYSGEDLNGKDSAEIISILNRSDIPVILPWSPGKWLGKRGKSIEHFISEFPRLRFMIGDISMRAGPEPRLFQKAKHKSMRILYGSDSLPTLGEEKLAGTYFTSFEVQDDFSYNMENLRAMLFNSPAPCLWKTKQSSSGCFQVDRPKIEINSELIYSMDEKKIGVLHESQ